MRDNLNKVYDVGLVSECEYDEDSVSNEDKNNEK